MRRSGSRSVGVTAGDVRCPADDPPPLDNRGRRRGLPDRGRDLRDAREPRALHPAAVRPARGDRETFAFAIAIQNLLWGIGQPFAGAIADRYGSGRVLAGGGLLYVA